MKKSAAALALSCSVGAGAACAPAGDQEPAGDDASATDATIMIGEAIELGGGSAQTFVELDSDGSPVVVGVTFNESLLEVLPTEPDGTMACFDADEDGNVDPSGECMLGVQRNLAMPEGAAAGLPFQWVGLNWNPEGHPPPAPPVYAVATSSSSRIAIHWRPRRDSRRRMVTNAANTPPATTT